MTADRTVSMWCKKCGEFGPHMILVRTGLQELYKSCISCEKLTELDFSILMKHKI